MLNKLNILTALVAVFFFWNCAPEKSPKKEVKKTSTPTKEKKQSLLDEAKANTYVWLNDENAVPFLKQYGKENPERKFKITTPFGEIVIKLSNKAPIHTANFLYLVKEKQYFDNTFFYRVAPKFIVQGGNADNDFIQSKRFAIGDYSLPAEFTTTLYHKRGAVAQTRVYGPNNPEKRSTPFDFYIVVGKKHKLIQLSAIATEQGLTFTEAQKKVYQEQGGAPHLDFEHTVFGEVLSGMEVADKISVQEADSREWPKKNIPMTIEIIE